MHLFAMNFRECDGQGCGHFGASRGSRLHKGVDMACVPGTEVGSPVKGEVTKLGWPYVGVPDIRYVQVTVGEYNYRMMYVDPCVEVGDWVELGQIIGESQHLDSMDDGGTQHVHFEIKGPGGRHVDPTPLIYSLRSTLRDEPVE